MRAGRARGGPGVDNDFYERLGSRWTDDPDHAIALLAAEAPVKVDYARAAMGGGRRRVIDIGCGAGFVSIPLATDGHEVVAVDRSPSTLEVGRSLATRAGASVQFRHGDAHALADPDRSFDAALLLDVLEHVDEAATVIGEAVRVVRPGGTIVFHTFTRNPVAHLVAVVGPRVITRHCPRHLHVYGRFLRPRELRRLFEANGATVAEVRGVRPVLDLAFARTVRHRRVDPGFAFVVDGPVLAGYVGVARRHD